MGPSSTPPATASTWRTGAPERPCRARGWARRGLLALALGAATTLAAGCRLFEDGPGFDPIDAVVPSFTDDEERVTGRQFDRVLRKKVRVIQDPVVNEFLNDLGHSIVGVTGRQPFVYRFRVIDDPSLNAFAVFGGYIYFHSGTLLAASSVDELAGVMGHEIAHVRQRHHARMAQKAQIPDLLARAGGLAVATVASEPGVFVAAESVNVALQLHFSREFEAEADHHGAEYMASAGYDPRGIATFFGRILAEQRKYPDVIPPYLYSHPEVENRILAVETRAAALRRGDAPSRDLSEAMRDAQARLALLLDTRRENWIESPAQPTAWTDQLLRQAERATRAGAPRRALSLLARAQAAAPSDPRVHFHRGELLATSGRNAEAVASYRRTIRLDPTRALVYLRLAEAHKALGERVHAVYAFEQAARRAGEKSPMRVRAEWEVEKLTFDYYRHCRDPAYDPSDFERLAKEAKAEGIRLKRCSPVG